MNRWSGLRVLAIPLPAFDQQSSRIECRLIVHGEQNRAVCRGVAGLEANRLPISGNRFVHPPQLVQDQAKIVVRFGKIGLEQGRLSK